MIAKNEMLESESHELSHYESEQVRADFDALVRSATLHGDLHRRFRTIYWIGMIAAGWLIAVGILLTISSKIAFSFEGFAVSYFVVIVTGVILHFVAYKFSLRSDTHYQVLKQLLALARQTGDALARGGHITELKWQTAKIELSRFGI